MRDLKGIMGTINEPHDWVQLTQLYHDIKNWDVGKKFVKTGKIKTKAVMNHFNLTKFIINSG